MIHPDADRLTAWAHDLLDPEESAPVEAHARECADCAERAGGIRRESAALAAALADRSRLEALKQGLLDRAETAPRGARWGKSLWQIPAAAAVLFSLVVSLAVPSAPPIQLVDGRVGIGEDGREVTAPARLEPGEVRALEASTLRLAEQSTVKLDSGARLGLTGGRNAEAVAGRMRFTVTGGEEAFVVRSEAGRVESGAATYDLKVVARSEGEAKMKGMMSGIVVTVLAGSVGLANGHGSVEGEPGKVAVLASSQAPLFTSQDDPEALLHRIEQLAAAIAKLEAEIARLEAQNKSLKARIKQGVNGAGGAFYGTVDGSASGLRTYKLQGGEGNVIIQEKVLIEQKKKQQFQNRKKGDK